MSGALQRARLVLAVACLAIACRQPLDRRALLAQTVRTVVLRSYARLTTTAAALAVATRALEASPTALQLQTAQAEWREALAALEYTYAFRIGPIAELNLHLREAYWPVRAASLERLAQQTPGQREIDQAGAAVKGLFAIELLLFEPAAGPGRSTGRLLVLLAEHYERSCRAVETAARDGKLAEQLAARGQAGIALLVNDLIETVETARAALEQGARAGVVAGGRSGSIPLIARARLNGVRDHYLGEPPQGLATLVQTVAPAVDEAVQRALTDAIKDVAPSSSQPPSPVACHTLEIALKSGLPAALGVTLTTRSADGD